MSIEAVNQFLQKVTQDPQLQQEFAKTLDVGNDQQAVTDLAVKHGYEFTSDEFEAETQNRQSNFQQRQAAGELNQEELEAASGGGIVPDSISTGITLVDTLSDKEKLGDGLDLSQDRF